MGLGTRKCVGHLKEVKECEFIDSCDLCRVVTNVDNDEIYIFGVGSPSFRCKRDNPNFKPMTKSQFLKVYKEMPNKTVNVSITELLEGAIAMGMVEE